MTKVSRDEILAYVRHTRPRSARQKKLKEKILQSNLRVQNMYSLHEDFKVGDIVVYQGWSRDQTAEVYVEGKGTLYVATGDIRIGATHLARVQHITNGGQRINLRFLEPLFKKYQQHGLYTTKFLNYAPFTGVYLGHWPHTLKAFEGFYHSVKNDSQMGYLALESMVEWPFRKWDKKFMFTPVKGGYDNRPIQNLL